jgi:hypothetical protein
MISLVKMYKWNRNSQWILIVWIYELSRFEFWTTRIPNGGMAVLRNKSN